MVVEDRILRKLEIEPATTESFRIFVAGLKTILQYSEEESVWSLRTWKAPVLSKLDRLSPSEIAFIESELRRVNIPISECQVLVQKLILQDVRKKFAVYYTVDQATQFMASVTREYLRTFNKQKVVIADPFLGSARTLTSVIREIGVEKIAKVWGVEPLALPAFIAYASLLDAVKGRRDIITVIRGDAFKEIPRAFSPLTKTKLPRADIILTNPPFTRWKYLEKSYRSYLLKLMNQLGYKDYITRKEISLQTLSMFLSDWILNKNGLIISVLPSSTFYTIYGRGYKSLLKKNYEVLAIVESSSRPSFSEDSGFKEVIIVAVKTAGEKPTIFTRLDNDVEKVAEIVVKSGEVNSFNIRELPHFLDINWLALFDESKLRDIVINIFEQGLRKRTLGYWGDTMGRKSIIRGIEMYGPEFFFIPNKYWRLLKDGEESVEIENIENKTKLTISKEFLVRTLRKPSLYHNIIDVRVDSYMLSLPPLEINEFPTDLRDYIKWGIDSNTAKPAIKTYGKYWYSHVYKQIKTKQPFGQVFIPDKVDLMFKQRSVFANYTREKVAASKNFYIIKENNEIINKLLVGWFNSTIFLSILVLLGRKISETWTRFLENDYLELPTINITTVKALEVCEIVENMMKKQLPPLWEQLKKDYRYELDVSIAKIIKLDNPEETVQELHQVLLDSQFNTQ